MSTELFNATLESISNCSPNVRHFVFRTECDPAFQYLAGQFITIHFTHEDKILKRSYSIANPPNTNNTIEFAAGYVENGTGSKLLFSLNPGDSIKIQGPFGRLILKDTAPKRYVLVATSTGVTPYRAMLPDLSKNLDDNPDMQVVILQGVQTASDILYADDFLNFTKKYPARVLFHAHLSRELPNANMPYTIAGHVQNSFAKLSLNYMEDVVYLCGNPCMIDDAFTLLKEAGFTTQNIIREKYISR